MLKRIETKGADFFSAAVREVELYAVDLAFFGEHAKNVWPDAELERVLRLCTRVQELLLISMLPLQPILSLLANSRPKRMLLVPVMDKEDPGLNFAPPMFQQLTHLVIGDFATPHAFWGITGLGNFTSSTGPPSAAFALSLISP
ncbi:hypothetical protein B0H19DRAFT_1382513 [Mycena capillaripes]|nr:hypothetical protein B0H19DRAFT_1382513 [Mycena capillaripes]